MCCQMHFPCSCFSLSSWFYLAVKLIKTLSLYSLTSKILHCLTPPFSPFFLSPFSLLSWIFYLLFDPPRMSSSLILPRSPNYCSLVYIFPHHLDISVVLILICFSLLSPSRPSGLLQPRPTLLFSDFSDLGYGAQLQVSVYLQRQVTLYPHTAWGFML